MLRIVANNLLVRVSGGHSRPEVIHRQLAATDAFIAYPLGGGYVIDSERRDIK